MFVQPFVGAQQQPAREMSQQISYQFMSFGNEYLLFFPVFFQFQRTDVFDLVFTQHDVCSVKNNIYYLTKLKRYFQFMPIFAKIFA